MDNIMSAFCLASASDGTPSVTLAEQPLDTVFRAALQAPLQKRVVSVPSKLARSHSACIDM